MISKLQKFFLYNSTCPVSGILHTANVEIRQCVKMVPYKRLRNNEVKLPVLKLGCVRLQEVVVYAEFPTAVRF